MRKVGFDKALFIAEKMRPEFTYNMAKLEGNTATYSQVETIVHGLSVSGLSMQDIRQVDNIARGWNLLLDELKNGDFSLSKQNTIFLNMTVAEGENRLNFGSFRNGPVAINGTDYIPPMHLDLPLQWDSMINSYKSISDPLEQSIFLYGELAKNQFFGDGNKRTALLVMNGCLISEGYCPITISPNDNKEYRDVLLNYYENSEKYKQQFSDFMKYQQLKVLKKWSYDIDLPNTESELGKTIDASNIKTKPAVKITVIKNKDGRVR